MGEMKIFIKYEKNIYPVQHILDRHKQRIIYCPAQCQPPPSLSYSFGQTGIA